MMVQTAHPQSNIWYAAPVAIALGWIAALLLAPEFGAIAYAAPFVAPVGYLALVAIYKSPSRRVLTTTLLLVTVLFVLNLNFRQRELGETGLDWQNGTKLAVWSASSALAFFNGANCSRRCASR